jgi:glycosyltransferase involved in cell wall biosynthesis
MKNKKYKLISLVIPIRNEEENILSFVREVSRITSNQRKINFEFIFVNDGSTDKSINILLQLKKKDFRIKIIDLSRNFGKESALTAGLNFSSGDAVIPIDVDLQDPVNLIPQMISRWQEGFDVVLCQRHNRDSDTKIKKFSADFFYYIINKFSNIEIPKNVGDFRLIDRKAVDSINLLNESNRFMKGLFAWVGFKTTSLSYTRPPRRRGSSKFSNESLFNLALDGLTSFGSSFLNLSVYIGFFISLLSVVFGIFIIYKKIFLGISISGYASTIVAITFMAGLQILFIGILGLYIGKIYIESKKRPLYIVKKYYK